MMLEVKNPPKESAKQIDSVDKALSILECFSDRVPELSLKQLLRIKKVLLIGGIIQMGGTIIAVFVISILFGKSMQMAILGGFLAALSSTAIGLKILQERAELDSPHGRSIVGILMFQDIAVVPLMLLIPLLSHSGSTLDWSLGYSLLKAGLIISVLIALSSCAPFKAPDRTDGHQPVPDSYSLGDSVSSPDAQWWLEFSSVQLNELVDRALSGNLNLQAYWARLERAEALSRRAGSALWPTVSGEASGSYSKSDSQISTNGYQVV